MLKLPPGKYYIGDPGYVFNDDTWQRLLNTVELEGEIVEFDGSLLWGHGIANGDGEFEDQNGNKFGVDTGLLAAIPIELIENPAGEEHGTVFDAPGGIIVEHDNGTFWFAGICIKTGDDFEEFDLDDGAYDGDLDSEFL